MVTETIVMRSFVEMIKMDIAQNLPTYTRIALAINRRVIKLENFLKIFRSGTKSNRYHRPTFVIPSATSRQPLGQTADSGSDWTLEAC